MSDRMSECMSGRVPESMSDRVSDYMSDRMAEFLLDRMSEFMLNTGFENVMDGIPRSKIITFLQGGPFSLKRASITSF